MLEIRPIPDPHEMEALAARCRVTYQPHCLAYAAFSGNAPIALCRFRYDNDGCAYIHAVGHTDAVKDRPEEAERLTLVGALAFCTQNGCDRFIFEKNIPASLPEHVGLHRDQNGTAWFW